MTETRARLLTARLLRRSGKERWTRRFWRRRLVRAVFAASMLLLFFVAIPAFVIAPVAPPWIPEPVEWWAYDTRLALGRPLTTMTSLGNALIGEPEMEFLRGGERISLKSDGLTLIGDLYRPATTGPSPGILILHGSTPQGRRLGMYRILGHELSGLGYVVLIIDQRGYGESDDPPGVTDPNDFDFVTDARNTIRYLRGLDGVDPERLYLVGHSFGADVALATATEETTIQKLIAIGPGRRLTERAGTVDAPETDYFRRREMRYMGLDEPVTVDVFLQSRARLSIENHPSYFQNEKHVPILLIDGERESSKDHQFLRDAFQSMVGEKAYVTLDRADHYANIANLGALIIYDAQAVTQLVREIDKYLSYGR